MTKSFVLVLFVALTFVTLSYAQPIPNHYPVPPVMLNNMMFLSEDWHTLRNQSLQDNSETTAVISNKSSYIETHVFDLYTMLKMEEDHARNSNLSRFACQALIENISSFKDQLNMEINSFKTYYQKQNDPSSRKTLEQFGSLLEKTKKVVEQIEAETKKNYVTLDV